MTNVWMAKAKKYTGRSSSLLEHAQTAVSKEEEKVALRNIVLIIVLNDMHIAHWADL